MVIKKIPSYLLGKNQVIGTIIFSIMFAIIFLNLYIPFSDTAWFGLGKSETFLYTVVFILIALLMLILSRLALYYFNKRWNITYIGYFIWCLMEIILTCTIYMKMSIAVDTPEMTNIEIFKKAFPYCAIALGTPYFIAALYLTIQEKNQIIKIMSYENVATDEVTKSEAPLKKITLLDSNGTLKMAVSLENLYMLQSDDNYIKVWYTDSHGELQRYLIRCRLKTIEDSFKDCCLIRCNRQHIVNMNKVGNFRKENGGYILETDNQDIPPITVTKRYIENVLTYFAEFSPLMDPLEE